MSNYIDQLLNKRSELQARLNAVKQQVSTLRAQIGALDTLIDEGRAQTVAPKPNLDTRLYNALTSLRTQCAREVQAPPYTVFNDETLVEIVRQKPETELALYKVKGIGAKRLCDWGHRIVACVLREVGKDETLPERPYFERCSDCNDLQVLAKAPAGRYRCHKCAKSTDPRSYRTGISVKLPTAKEFD